jgi:hypothetical protein
MVDLARLIRPFEGVEISYPRRIVNDDATPPANVVLKVGDNGGTKTLGYSRTYSLTTYMQQKQKEVVAPPDEKPDGRQRHVKRIPGKTKDASGAVTKVPGAWLDVERLEEVTTEEGSGINYQKSKTKFQWYVDDKGEVPNPARVTRTLTVIPTDADPDNPYVFWEIDVNDAVIVMDFDQRIKRRLDNSANNQRRRNKAKVRRVKHFDTPYDDDPAYQDGGIIRSYKKTEGTKDDDQYLDVEIPGEITFDDWRLNQHLTPKDFEHWQRTACVLNNGYLVDAADEPDKSYGGDQINPPVRLDWLQNIVNLQAGGATEFIDFNCVIDPPATKSQRFTFSFFIFIPEEFGSLRSSTVGVPEFGHTGFITPGIVNPQSSNLTFVSDGRGKVNIFTGFRSGFMTQLGEDAFFTNSYMEFGAVTQNAASFDSSSDPGIMTVGEWHHIFCAGDMSPGSIQTHPVPFFGFPFRAIDVYFSCLNPLYLDRVSVGKSDRYDEYPVGGQDRMICGPHPIAMPAGAHDLVMVAPDFTRPAIRNPDSTDEEHRQHITMPFSGISFDGGMGIPNLQLTAEFADPTGLINKVRIAGFHLARYRRPFVHAGRVRKICGIVQFGAWRPRFIVVHNTSAPDLKTWNGWQARKPPITDEKWAQNLVGYYRDQQHWSAGPHLFVTPAGILVFSPLTGPGTHSPAWNSISWGVETVGEFEREPFAGRCATT